LIFGAAGVIVDRVLTDSFSPLTAKERATLDALLSRLVEETEGGARTSRRPA